MLTMWMEGAGNNAIAAALGIHGKTVYSFPEHGEAPSSRVGSWGLSYFSTTYIISKETGQMHPLFLTPFGARVQNPHKRPYRAVANRASARDFFW